MQDFFTLLSTKYTAESIPRLRTGQISRIRIIFIMKIIFPGCLQKSGVNSNLSSVWVIFKCFQLFESGTKRLHVPLPENILTSEIRHEEKAAAPAHLSADRYKRLRRQDRRSKQPAGRGAIHIQLVILREQLHEAQRWRDHGCPCNPGQVSQSRLDRYSGTGNYES